MFARDGIFGRTFSLRKAGDLTRAARLLENQAEQRNDLREADNQPYNFTLVKPYIPAERTSEEAGRI